MELLAKDYYIWACYLSPYPHRIWDWEGDDSHLSIQPTFCQPVIYNSALIIHSLGDLRERLEYVGGEGL